MRMQRIGDQKNFSFRVTKRNERRFGERRGAIVERGVRNIEPENFGDDTLEFKNDLERALARFGLIRRVRGGELAARADRADHGRNEMIVGTGAEKTER